MVILCWFLRVQNPISINLFIVDLHRWRVRSIKVILRHYFIWFMILEEIIWNGPMGQFVKMPFSEKELRGHAEWVLLGWVQHRPQIFWQLEELGFSWTHTLVYLKLLYFLHRIFLAMNWYVRPDFIYVCNTERFPRSRKLSLCYLLSLLGLIPVIKGL